MNSLKNERGYLLLNVVFLTLITSFAAMILINAAPRARNPHSTLRLTALHLANEKFALIESRAAEENILDLNSPIPAEDLTAEILGKPITFTVTAREKSSVGNLHEIIVKVEWRVGIQDTSLEVERTIRVGQ